MKKSLFATAFLLLFSTLCRAQAIEPIIILPSFQERFGENVRKVEARDIYPDGHSSVNVYVIERDGRFVNKTWTQPKLKYDKKTKEWVAKGKNWIERSRKDTVSPTRIVTRAVERRKRKGSVTVTVNEYCRNLQTRTDSSFRGYKHFNSDEDVTDTLPMVLKEVIYYRGTGCDTIRKIIYIDTDTYKKRVNYKVDSFYFYDVGDTLVTVKLHDTSLHCTNPQKREVWLKFKNVEETYVYAADSTLDEKYRYVYNSRNLIDTAYKYRRHGTYIDCATGLTKAQREARKKEYRSVETYQYEFDKNGALVEEREYEDGKLFRTTCYKIKYYRKKRKAKSK